MNDKSLLPMKMNIKISSVAATLAAGFMFMISCQSDPLSPGVEYMPDMYRSIAYKPYEENPIFKDGLGALTPPIGTVSRGAFPNAARSVNSSFYPYANTPEGYEEAGKNLKNPLPFSDENLAKGKEIYTKFCVVCHGDDGKGEGPIVKNGKYPSPGAYALKEGLTEGKMFHTLTYGKGIMGQHASQLSKEERWLTVFYVQELIRKANPAATANTPMN
jgi:mono/diheme cytochrome c family protein